jgi:hypothetical protein
MWQTERHRASYNLDSILKLVENIDDVNMDFRAWIFPRTHWFAALVAKWPFDNSCRLRALRQRGKRAGRWRGRLAVGFHAAEQVGHPSHRVQGGVGDNGRDCFERGRADNLLATWLALR